MLAQGHRSMATGKVRSLKNIGACCANIFTCELWIQRSSWVAKASSESERKRLRRMPRSTSATLSEAREIQAKSADAASVLSSDWISVLQISSGAPGNQEHQILQERVNRSQQLFRFVAAFSPRPISFRNLEQLAVVTATQRGCENGERV